jgi:hypothetical protein
MPDSADEHAGEFRNFVFHERRVALCVASVNKRCGKSLGRHAVVPDDPVIALYRVVLSEKREPQDPPWRQARKYRPWSRGSAYNRNQHRWTEHLTPHGDKNVVSRALGISITEPTCHFDRYDLSRTPAGFVLAYSIEYYVAVNIDDCILIGRVLPGKRETYFLVRTVRCFQLKFRLVVCGGDVSAGQRRDSRSRTYIGSSSKRKC